MSCCKRILKSLLERQSEQRAHAIEIAKTLDGVGLHKADETQFKLLGNVCRMDDQRWIKTLMLGMKAADHV